MGRPSKYHVIASHIRERIETGDYPLGGPLPQAKELAEDFGVHSLTLRKALDSLVADKVLVRHPGQVFFVGAHAARNTGNGILYIAPTSGHFYDSLYHALCGEAQERKEVITSYNPSETDETPDVLRDAARRCGGILCMAESWPLVAPAIGADMRVTILSCFRSLREASAKQRPGYYISTNQYRAAKMAVRHLADLGHRHIGLLDVGRRRDHDSLIGKPTPAQEATVGYRDALREHGLTDETFMIIPDWSDTDDWQAYEADSIRATLEQWTELPTAILCACDFRAAPLLRVLRERGLRVPQDISVMGIGNTPWAMAVDPQLTTVCLGETEMARLALILNQEPEPATARVIRVDPELVVRHSTAAPTRK